MAEARCGREQSMRDVRDAGGGRRHPRGTNTSAERNKPEQQSSSQGALSSIRAAIMRTSRGTAQEQHRDRRSHRRPQITILSAEPMATPWFPAAPPPAAIQVPPPPPSYEQVLREKTREQEQQHQHPMSTPASSSSSSTGPAPTPTSTSTPSTSHSTIATQTDGPATPLPATISPSPATTTSPASKPALRRPPRPPKPPCPPKPDAGTNISTQTSLEQPQEGAIRPRPRPRSRAGLRPISEEIISSRQMNGECESPQPIAVGLPKSQSLNNEIVVAQPVSSERGVTSQPIGGDLVAIIPSADQSEGGVCAQGESACLVGESVCVGGQYLQDLLDVFGPGSSSSEYGDNPNIDSHGDITTVHSRHPHGDVRNVDNEMAMKGKRETEEEEEEDEEVRGACGGMVRPPQPMPRRRTPTPIPMPIQSQTQTVSISGSPSPPQPQPRRRSLPFTTNTSPRESDSPGNSESTGSGVPARFLPLRPPPIKLAKSPILIGSSPASTAASTNQQEAQKLPKRGPPLPPRPKPGHPLFRASQAEDLSLIDLSDTLADFNKPSNTDSETHTDSLTDNPLNSHTDVPTQGEICSNTPADVSKHMYVHNPVDSSVSTHIHTQSYTPQTQISDYAEISSNGSKETAPEKPSPNISLDKSSGEAMCCVAIFAFRGEENDELTFSEGDVILLIDYINEEWGHGHLNGHSGIFPLCFTSSPQPHSEIAKVKVCAD